MGRVRATIVAVKTISIAYSDSMFAVLVIKNVMCMRHIVICGLKTLLLKHSEVTSLWGGGAVVLFFSVLAQLINHYFRVISGFGSGCLFGGLEMALYTIVKSR